MKEIIQLFITSYSNSMAIASIIWLTMFIVTEGNQDISINVVVTIVLGLSLNILCALITILIKVFQ